MFDKVPFYGQMLIFFGISLAIVGMAYYVFPNLSEMQSKIDRYEDDFAEKEREILKGQAIEQRLPELEREIEEKKRELGDIQQILPTGQETGQLLAWIKNTGDQANLDLKSFAPSGLKDVEFYKEFPIEMQVVGRYHDLGIFLDRVSKYARIINVDDLQINAARNEGDKTIAASFTATTFVYEKNRAAASPMEEQQ